MPHEWVCDKATDHGRVFYTCLGHPDDFKQEAFGKLLTNGLAWAVKE